MMERLPFVLKFKEGQTAAGLEMLKTAWSAVAAEAARQNAYNVSVWSIADFALCYGEYPSAEAGVAVQAAVSGAIGETGEVFAAQGTLPLMYHDIGIVREDKSLIRHRVFATKLKEGCAAEYKRRHDALVEARGDKISEGPESNFTIWNANGYIFGYCELVKAFDHEMTEEEKASTIAWETRQLEIMDWLTDDVDWITGQKHDAIQLVAQA